MMRYCGVARENENKNEMFYINMQRFAVWLYYNTSQKKKKKKVHWLSIASNFSFWFLAFEVSEWFMNIKTFYGSFHK